MCIKRDSCEEEEPNQRHYTGKHEQWREWIITAEFFFPSFVQKKKKKKNVFKWSPTLHLTICQQTCHFQNWCLHKSGDRSQRVHAQGGTAVFPGAAEKQQSHPAFPLSTIVRGQAVSHPQTQERPDSRREAIYTDASSAEWNVMFCGWHRSPGRTCEASWWWPIPSAVHLCSH